MENQTQCQTSESEFNKFDQHAFECIQHFLLDTPVLHLIDKQMCWPQYERSLRVTFFLLDDGLRDGIKNEPLQNYLPTKHPSDLNDSIQISQKNTTNALKCFNFGG